MLKKRGIFLFGFFCFSLLPYFCFSAPTPKEWGKIMNLSGRQRMLSQKMAKEALLIAAGIEPEVNRQKLKETMRIFETTLRGLRDGDVSLGLPPCEYPDIVMELDKVKLAYQALYPVLSGAVAGKRIDFYEMQQIAKLSLPILHKMNRAVGMFEKEAKKVLKKDPTLALVINIAGRQRMLTQKMAKEALLMYHKIDVDNQSSLLKGTADLFERSLKGLRDGDEKTGLPPTTDENIKGQLDVVKSFWLVVKPLINKISNLGTTIVTREEIITVTSVLDNLLKESNQAVSMYEKLTQ